MKEEDELELALEIPLHTKREHANSLLSHDADLARALEQSLLEPTPRPVHPRSRSNTTPGVNHNVDPNPSEGGAPLPLYDDVVRKELGMCRCSVSSRIL